MCDFRTEYSVIARICGLLRHRVNREGQRHGIDTASRFYVLCLGYFCSDVGSSLLLIHQYFTSFRLQVLGGAGLAATDFWLLC